jgi:RHS repeat-associated protein
LRQPTSATVGGATSTFSYDGNGDRATITTGGVARSEVWDGADVMSVLVAERNGTGGLLRSYTHVGGVPARYTDHGSNSTGFYLTDTLGSVSNLTTTTGTVAGTYRYDSYGATRASTSVTAPYSGNPLRFTGQQQDPTGLYNLRARRYNPATGRFTQTDPLARTTGAYLNAYEYANLNPLVFVDPTGLRGQNGGNGRCSGGWRAIGCAAIWADDRLGWFGNASAAALEGAADVVRGPVQVSWALGQSVTEAFFVVPECVRRFGYGFCASTAAEGATRGVWGATGGAVQGFGQDVASGNYESAIRTATPVAIGIGTARASRPKNKPLIEEGTYVVKTSQGEYVVAVKPDFEETATPRCQRQVYAGRSGCGGTSNGNGRQASEGNCRATSHRFEGRDRWLVEHCQSDRSEAVLGYA